MSDRKGLPMATSTGHKAAGNYAARVSRTLRRAGIMATGGSGSRTREGIRVSAHEVGLCWVKALFINEDIAADRIEECAGVLRRAGYTVEQSDAAHPVLSVKRGPVVATEWKKRKDPMGNWSYEHRWYPGWVIEITDDGFPVRKGRTVTEPFETMAQAAEYVEEQPR